MIEDGHVGSSSLEAKRALERRLAERSRATSALDASLAAACEQAERLRAQARAQGEQAARDRRRRVLAEAARIRVEGEERAAELRMAMAATFPETLAVLSSIVLPATEEYQCSSR